MTPDDIDPELAKKLQAQVDFINELEQRYAAGTDIRPLLDELDAGRARGLVMALIIVRAADRAKLQPFLDLFEEQGRQLEALGRQVRDRAREDTQRALAGEDVEVLRLQVEELQATNVALRELVSKLGGYWQ